MTSSSTHCDHCGAPVRTPGAAFCGYCGTKLPVDPASPVAAAPTSPFGDLPARFDALRAHPEREELQTVDVDLTRQALGLGCHVVFLIGFVVIALKVASGFSSFGDQAGGPRFPGGGGMNVLFSLVPLIVVGGGVVMLVALLRKSAKFAGAPLERLDRLWIDERTKVSGGGDNSGATTTYFATLEGEDGQRREYQVGGKLTGRCSPGDMGVAFIKGDLLVDFRRVPV